MGRPLKIQKYNPMSGIFYNNQSQGTTAAGVTEDAGYPPYAAPTSIDLPTVVQPGSVPFTGVVGGAQVLSQPSASYPVVECQVNIRQADGSAFGVHNGRILRQKGVRKFMVVDNTVIQDENVYAGNTYMILSAQGTDWTQWGAPKGWVVGTVFTCTGQGTLANGTALLVGTCTLYSTTPTVGNMAITMTVNGTTTYISKLTNKYAQDFNGGETGGNANTGNVWSASQVKNNIDYAANFFADNVTVAKSGADVATWAGTNQNSNGTLNLGEVENYTS